jgi:hypothetical protein
MAVGEQYAMLLPIIRHFSRVGQQSVISANPALTHTWLIASDTTAV